MPSVLHSSGHLVFRSREINVVDRMRLIPSNRPSLAIVSAGGVGERANLPALYHRKAIITRRMSIVAGGQSIIVGI